MEFMIIVIMKMTITAANTCEGITTISGSYESTVFSQG